MVEKNGEIYLSLTPSKFEEAKKFRVRISLLQEVLLVELDQLESIYDVIVTIQKPEESNISKFRIPTD